MGKCKKYAIEAAAFIFGSFFLAASINIFMAQNKISAGGISSVATVLYHLFGIRLSVTNIALNAILFIFGLRYLKKSSVIKTIAGIVLSSLFLELTSYIRPYTEDLLIATICGGILMGLGVGLIVRQEGSTGGSDFAGLIIKGLFPHFSLARIILVIDLAIITVAGVVFKSFSVTIYSAAALYICSKVTDAVICYGDKTKEVNIISSCNEQIASFIMQYFEHGVTSVKIVKQYTNCEAEMLMCIVLPKELPLLINKIREIDSKAFVIINNAHEVLGEGFKTL